MSYQPSRLTLLLALAPVAIAGCAGKPLPGPATNGPATNPVLASPDASDLSPAALFGAPRAFHLDVYQVVVPFGTISRNEDFWRRVDEELIDPATKDLLLKNGVRAGLSANADWEYFKDAIESAPHFARNGTAAAAAGSGFVELTMKENVPEQTIYFVSDRAAPYGRTYQKCHDLIGVSFAPDRRRPGEMQLSLSPVVRATRTERYFTARGEEKYLVENRPEFLYELNLRTNIPPDRFLVVGLAPEGERPSSLGHQFLTLPGAGEMKEQVLVFVPRLPARKAPAATRTAPDVNAGDAPGR